MKIPSETLTHALLFVYGTLRPDHAGPMAACLRLEAQHVGRAWIAGTLYRIADYPGLVPDPAGQVVGDLFMLPDAHRLLPILDAHEECSDDFPEPREYRREWLTVHPAQGGTCGAWAYVYARDVAPYNPIDGGDFLA